MALTPGQLAAQQELLRRQAAGKIGQKGLNRLNALGQGAASAAPAQAGNILKQYPQQPGAVPPGGAAPPDATYTAKEVFGEGRDLAGAGMNMAGNRMANEMSDPFAPTLSERPGTGNLEADRARIEEAVYGRLSKNFDRDEGLDRQRIEQRLAEQGIQFDANPNSRYQQEMTAFNEGWSDRKLAARQEATRMGLAEHQGEFQIGEDRRNNDYDIQSGTRDINSGEILDTGRMAADIFASLEGLNDVDKQRALEKWIAKLNAKTSTTNANIAAGASKYASDKAASGGGGSDNDIPFM